MECVQAQQVISAALDREPVDAYQLEEAKAHCRACADCGLFVRALLVAEQVPLPEPPAELAERVMAQVRAEAATTQAAADAARAAAEASAAAQAAAALPPTPVATLAPKPRTARKLPRMWVSAAAAAAVMVALVGTVLVVIFGMGQMTGGPATTSRIYRNGESAAQAPGISTELGGGKAAAPAAGSAETTGAQSITVNGTVYKLVGPAKVNTSTATVIGSTNTALGEGNTLQLRTVWAATSPDTVYVADDEGNLFSFARVTRTYVGLTFVLTAGELSSYSQWPQLPTQIAPPTSADGQPTFTYDGTDSSGTRVYRLTNSSATQGIAIPPNTGASDPAGGNPNWTWWAILH